MRTSSVAAALLGVAALSVPTACTSEFVANWTVSGTWFVPPGVSKVTVEMWGGGGAPGSSFGGCGAAWGRAVDLYVPSNTTCNLSVGTGGYNGEAGTISAFECPNAQRLFVEGGPAGNNCEGGALPSGPWSDKAAGHSNHETTAGGDAGRAVPGQFGRGGDRDGHGNGGLVMLKYEIPAGAKGVRRVPSLRKVPPV